MKKRALSVCLAGTVLCGAVTIPALGMSVSQLGDVPASAWYYPYVKFVAENEYMVGVDEDTFAPDMPMTRAMFVTVLSKLDGVTAGGAQTSFVDVPAEAWYAKAVNWATQRNIVAGIGDGKFDPDAPINREQMCVIMSAFMRYWAQKEDKIYRYTVDEKTFADGDQISSYAATAVKSCQMWGLISGDPDGNFNPLSASTRAEVAVVIKQLADLLDSGSTIPSTEGGGGGGGGGGDIPPPPTPVTSQYFVKVNLTVPEDLAEELAGEGMGELLLQTPIYSVTNDGNGTIANDQTVSDILNDLVTGNNVTAIDNAIHAALNRVKGRSVTQNIDGQAVTIDITSQGVISAKVAVKVTGLSPVQGRSVSQADVESLLNKLQNGGVVTFTEQDVEALDTLLTKAEDLLTMEPDQVQAKLDQYAQSNPDLKQAIEAMTPEEVQSAAGAYCTELEQLKTQLEAIPDGEPLVVELAEPVRMDVTMDLGTYYSRAVAAYQNRDNQDKFLERLEEELYPDGTKSLSAEQQALALDVYGVNNPANYVTDNGDKTLSLKTAEEYRTLITNNTAASCRFYESLEENEAFYQSLIDRAEEKYDEGYGVTHYEVADNVAAMLADQDGILYGITGTITPIRLQATGSESVYEQWVNLLSGKFDRLGDILPGEMPEALRVLLGDYEMTVSIQKMA